MNRFYLFLSFLCILSIDIYAQERTTLSSQIYGYKREMVYYDCLQTPFIKQEFHTNPGEEHNYSFLTNSIVGISVNGSTDFILQPGDSLHAVIKYEGKIIQSVDLSGTKNAVAANNLAWDIELFRRSLRYKSQLLGCAALDIKPKDRIADSKLMLEKVNDMIKKAGDNITEDAKNYILSDIEGEVYNSYMEYPVMYAEVRKVSIDKQEIGNYWDLMNGFVPRDDDASLSSNEYLSMLMRYCFYSNELKAHNNGVEYKSPASLENMFKELSEFYSGKQRDAISFMLIINFIMNGQEIERVDPILKEYKDNYNINPEYLKIIDSLLQ